MLTSNYFLALERQESFMEMTLAQVKNIRNESLSEMTFLEESIKDITNNSGVYLEKAMKDLVKIQNSSEAKMGNLTSELDRLNLVLEDVRETVSEVSKTDQKEIFKLYLNDSIKTLEKICNNQNATNKILDEINEVRILEGSIEDMTNQSKLFLEDIVKDFGETKNLRTGEISNLIGKMDILNLVMEELRETISESYSNKVCGKEDANKILEGNIEQIQST